MSFEEVSVASVSGGRPGSHVLSIIRLQGRPGTGSRPADRWKAAFRRNQPRRTSSCHLLHRFITLGAAKGRWWRVWRLTVTLKQQPLSHLVLSALWVFFFFFEVGGMGWGGLMCWTDCPEATGGILCLSVFLFLLLRFPRCRSRWKIGAGSAQLQPAQVLLSTNYYFC